MTELIISLLLSLGFSMNDVNFNDHSGGVKIIKTENVIIIILPDNSAKEIILIDDLAAGRL